MFSFNKAQEVCSLKIMNKASSSSHHQIIDERSIKDDEIELRSKRGKKHKIIFGPNFIAYSLKNKPQIYYKIVG